MIDIVLASTGSSDGWGRFGEASFWELASWVAGVLSGIAALITSYLVASKQEREVNRTISDLIQKSDSTQGVEKDPSTTLQEEISEVVEGLRDFAKRTHGFVEKVEGLEREAQSQLKRAEEAQALASINEKDAEHISSILGRKTIEALEDKNHELQQTIDSLVDQLKMQGRKSTRTAWLMLALGAVLAVVVGFFVNYYTGALWG